MRANEAVALRAYRGDAIELNELLRANEANEANEANDG